MNAPRWGVVAGLLAASAAQADVVCQERFAYPGGLARFLVSERAWVARAEAAGALRSSTLPVPLLAVRVRAAAKTPGEDPGSEGQGSPDSTGSEDPGTKGPWPEPFPHDGDTRGADALLEESP